jgi:hypothetical protein
MSASVKLHLGIALACLLFALVASQPALARNDSPPPVISTFERPSAAFRPLPLNHFYCYRIATSLPVSETVKTQDQFDPRFRKTRVGSPTHLCNPVRKIHNNVTSPILYPNDHLVFYNIGAHKEPAALKVRVNNQFGRQELEVYRPPEGLMVPTRKAPHDVPKDTDHFKCYFVKGKALDKVVSLGDQFQQTQTLVLEPFGLCNPTRKIHNNLAFGILHFKAHLVCYHTQARQFAKKVGTANQFRREKMTTILADVLCVPSRKALIP